jgi:taurine dioxygenase
LAIYHLRLKLVSRALGRAARPGGATRRSAVAAAAYRSGERLYDSSQGKWFEFDKPDVVHKEILAPDHGLVPEWVFDRQTLWNMVERAEKRVDAQLAREVGITLPAFRSSCGWRYYGMVGARCAAPARSPEEAMAARVVRLETDATRLEPETLSIDPLTPVIGAEIGGVDLSKPLSDEQFADIRAAFARHHVLVFRNQHLSVEDHKRFARRFGRLHVHPYNAMATGPDHARGNADPEILVVKANQKSRYVAGEGWHTDVTCDAEPPMGSMLYVTETPESGGGDTCFLSTARAYESLSPAMQAFLETLTAVHDGAKPYTGSYGTPPPEGGWPKNVHPVVVRHPDNGRKILYVNRGFTTRVVELSKGESDALLELLWRHIESHLDFQCRVRWTPNTLTFWDNRCTQHHAVWDYYPHSRYGQRVSIINGRPGA